MSKQYSSMISLTILLILSSFVVGFITHLYMTKDTPMKPEHNNQMYPQNIQQLDKSYNIDSHLLKNYKHICPIVIIGSGPAGCAAALYGGRLGIPTIVFEGENPGGQLMKTGIVENWPGTRFLEGPYIMQQAKEQAKTFGANFIQESVVSIDTSEWPYRVIGSDGTSVYALTIILATGATPKVLGVPGEREFWGKGVTTCAICDAALHKGNEVVIVGGGDSACEEATQLVPYASKIHMFVRGEQMRASKIMQDRVKNEEKIIIHYNTEIESIEGNSEDGVTNVIYNGPDGHKKLYVSGVFIAIGHVPNIDLVKNSIELDEYGLIKCIGNSQETSLKGVFAAGDIENLYRQAGVAAGNGIKATLDAANFLFQSGFNYTMLLNYKKSFHESTLRTLNKESDKLIHSNKIESLLAAHNEKKNTIPQKIVHVKTENEFNNFLTNHEIVMVDFYATWCPPCKKLSGIMEDYVNNNSLQFPIIKVNIEDTDLDRVATKYRIKNLPTIVVFKNNKEIMRNVGSMSKSEFANFVNTILK